MTGPERILIVEDERILADVLGEELERRGMRVTVAFTGGEAIRLLSQSFDAMVLDLGLPDMDGLKIFEAMDKGGNAPEVIILTGQAQVSTAVTAMKMGAYDYLEKPMDVDRIHLILKKASEKYRLRMENIRLSREMEKERPISEDIVVRSPNMEEVLGLARKVARNDFPVLVLGETGTGKDVLARIIHNSSSRSEGPFVVINCASLQQSTLENELFGHEKGAYTDAREAKPGFFEIADGGTMFLDEIGDMSFNLQAKLLRVIETGQFYRLGGTRLVRSDLRLITATNQDLVEKVRLGQFRQDLFFRINTLTLNLPPLRDRREEIIPLAEFFLQGTDIRKKIGPEARLALMRDYDWPGNIRELKHVIQRAAIISAAEEIGVNDLFFPMADGEAPSRELNSMEDVEREHIRRILSATGWKRKEASEVLGISSKTLYRKIREYGLTPGRD